MSRKSVFRFAYGVLIVASLASGHGEAALMITGLWVLMEALK